MILCVSVRWAAVAVLAAVVTVSCGGDEAGSRGAGDRPERVNSGQGDAPAVPPAGTVLLSGEPRSTPAPPADHRLAGEAISAFGYDLFRAVAAGTAADGNVVVSPASVAIALAMLEPGATGEARTQLRKLLRIEDPEVFHASMNALEQTLEARVAEPQNEGDKPGELAVRIANAAYLQQGYPFVPAYLAAIGAHYGPVLHAVDFRPDPDAVAAEINRFIAEATNDRLTDVVGQGDIKPETVLALVNALYLKASWLGTFDGKNTTDEPFTRLDGTDVTVPLMRGSGSSSARGDGWVGATKPTVGGLAVQFILPDEGRFPEVAGRFAEVVADYREHATSGSELALPRFETRFGTEISPALQALGLTAPFENGGLLDVADDDTLRLDQAIHHTFLAMDEDGLEAAAATVLLVVALSKPAREPVPVILDRPFLFRIYDQQTDATLFAGRIMDPTSQGR